MHNTRPRASQNYSKNPFLIYFLTISQRLTKATLATKVSIRFFINLTGKCAPTKCYNCTNGTMNLRFLNAIICIMCDERSFHSTTVCINYIHQIVNHSSSFVDLSTVIHNIYLKLLCYKNFWKHKIKQSIKRRL